MARKYLPGETPTLCRRDLTEPGSGALGVGTTVTMRLLDAGDVEVVAPVTAALSGTNDWCTSGLTMPTTLGTYRLETAITPSGGGTRYEHELVTVGPRYDVGGWTLRDLRRRIGRRLGDLRTARATLATGAGTFTAGEDLLLPNNAYQGRWAYAAVAAAGNRGKTRFVAGSTQTTGTLTFATAFPAAFAYGDELDLCGERGIGWRPDEYHEAINRAIRDAGDMGGVPLGATITGAFDADTGRLALPSGVEWVHAVEYQPPNATGWLPIEPSGDARRAGWFLPGDGWIELGGGVADLADGGSVRVLGAGRPDPLEDEEDATLVNAEFIEASALESLLLSGRRMDPERERLFGWAGDQRQRLRVQAVPLLDGESRPVRR